MRTGEGDWMDRVKLCNCAKCGLEMLGASMSGYFAALPDGQMKNDLPPMVAGRIADRPYCDACIAQDDAEAIRYIKRVANRQSRNTTGQEDSPWQQRALRDWEDSN